MRSSVVSRGVTTSRDEQTSFSLGLVGAGIGASLTPPMQEREGREAGLSLTYRLIDLDRLGMTAADLPEVLAWARRLGFDGLNVTHPFKQAVVPLLDELSEDAARPRCGQHRPCSATAGMLGRNTDWSGYSRAFQRGAARRGARPGGARRRRWCRGRGRLRPAAPGRRARRRSSTRPGPRDGLRRAAGKPLRRRPGLASPRTSTDALADAQGVVNATPVGMHGHPGSSVPADLLRRDLWVSDVVYFPLETELVAAARARGCRVLTGGGMAVQQAVGAFEYFTGRDRRPVADGAPLRGADRPDAHRASRRSPSAACSTTSWPRPPAPASTPSSSSTTT